MKEKKAVVLPLATALASLATATNAAAAPSNSSPDHGTAATDSQQANASNIQPNTIFQVGEDLLGLLMTKSADGTIVAQHASHASHASHHSHYSGR